MNARVATYLPAAVLLSGALLVSGIREQHVVPPRAAMNTLPTTFAGLAGTDMVVDEEERKVAGMSDYMMRRFGTDKTPLFSLYVGYYDRQVQGKTIHSPKNCMPGAGWETLSSEQTPIGTSVGAPLANRVILTNKGVRALVLYWYQGRGRVESSEYRVKWDLLRDAAMYGRTEEALVRIVIPIQGRAVPGQPDVALASADSIARTITVPLVESVNRVLPAFPGI